MAKQVFENMDILRHIYGFGDSTHRARLKEVLEEERPISSIPKNYLPQFQQRFKLFDKLVRCRCCSRHSHRKPWMKVEDNLLAYYMNYVPRVPEDKDLDDCRCACRRQARQLLRHIRVAFLRDDLPEAIEYVD